MLFTVREDEVARGPESLETADSVQEVLQEYTPLGGMHHLGMELDSVPNTTFAQNGDRGVIGVGERLKARGRFDDLITVTHPDGHGRRQVCKKRIGR